MAQMSIMRSCALLLIVGASFVAGDPSGICDPHYGGACGSMDDASAGGSLLQKSDVHSQTRAKHVAHLSLSHRSKMSWNVEDFQNVDWLKGFVAEKAGKFYEWLQHLVENGELDIEEIMKEFLPEKFQRFDEFLTTLLDQASNVWDQAKNWFNSFGGNATDHFKDFTDQLDRHFDAAKEFLKFKVNDIPDNVQAKILEMNPFSVFPPCLDHSDDSFFTQILHSGSTPFTEMLCKANPSDDFLVQLIKPGQDRCCGVRENLEAWLCNSFGYCYGKPVGGTAPPANGTAL